MIKSYGKAMIMCMLTASRWKFSGYEAIMRPGKKLYFIVDLGVSHVSCQS